MREQELPSHLMDWEMSNTQQWDKYLQSGVINNGTPDFFGKRGDWDFSRRDRQEKFNAMKKRGEIPMDADIGDYDAHHKIPVSEAKKRGYSPDEISNQANMVLLPRKDHQRLHRKKSLEQMADESPEPKQKGLWGRRKK